ncbi:MAG: MBL fold metallo-hydrolase [Deltaproteobacteria bacterium]|nr:MBL fold metallo-hydrolase [Deltaproteobacteria bacterium]
MEFPEFGYVPDETSWESLASLLKSSQPFFENTLFLQGYEFSSNIYLVKGDYLSIIDPGNDYTAFMDLFALGFKPPDVKKIVVTHGHQDHAGGAIEIFRAYRGHKDIDLEVILHEAGPEQLKAILREQGCRLTEVKGGEILDLSGFEVEVIHTPGHTIDGISLYHAPSRTVFTGDTVLPHAMAEPDQAVGGRLDHYLYSIRTLLKRDIENVMPGHGGLVVGIGRLVIQDTYEGLIKKLVGAETPWMEGANTLAQKGLLEEALFYSNKALAEDQENMQAVEFKAFLLNDLGRSAEASEFFDRLLARAGENLYRLLGKATALMGLGKYEESLDYFDRALQLDPQSKEALIHKGMALYLAGKPEEAMDIEVFKNEFTGRFKEELIKGSSPSP